MAISRKLCVVVAGFGLVAQGASAQNLRDLQISGQTDTRATASLTIPLGAHQGSRQSKPRVDFTFASQRIGQPHSVTPPRIQPDFERNAFHAAKLSFTLEQNPRLLLNEQRIATFGPRLTADEEEDEGKGKGGIGTAGWVVLGVGTLVGLSVLTAEAIKDDLEDAFGVDD